MNGLASAHRLLGQQTGQKYFKTVCLHVDGELTLGGTS
jgi:hypothetical protein